MLVGQAFVVDAQQVKNRRVEVVDVNAVGGDAVAERDRLRRRLSRA